MQLAFDEFKERFHNSPDQLSQDQRCSKKRSRLNGYFAAVEAQELYEEGRRGIGTWDDQAADFEATVDIGAGGGPTVAAAAVATVPRCRVRVRSPWEP